MGSFFETSTLKGELKNEYTMMEVIDYNVYGITHKCKETNTNNLVAIKIINKKYLERICGNKNLEDCLESIRQEIQSLKDMEGPFSVHLREYAETNDRFIIVTDLWDTTLEKFMKMKKTGIKMEELKRVFTKLNVAFKRMYDKDIIHGNIKLDNILLKNVNGRYNPLLSDYRKKAALDDRLTIMQSTTHYSAPELLIGDEYDYKVDLWSIGVIMYRLYFNEFPFNGETQVAIFNDIKKKKNLKKSNNCYFDDLIKKLLIIDSNYRITWEKYFNHKFWKSNEEILDNSKINGNNNLKEDIEDASESENNSVLLIRRESKYRSFRLKNSRNKYYNIYYSMNDNINDIITNINYKNNKNLHDLKKLEIEVEEKNKDKPIENIIFKELLKTVELNYLTKLILYGCNLNSTEIVNKLNPTNLLELDLSHNYINNIEYLSISNFDKLITLNLSHNNIFSIEPLINVGFINLINLNLSNNIINDIEDLALVHFLNLDRLKLAGNKIRDISVLTKVPFTKLTYLELRNNKITDISKALGNISISNLIYLDLSHNSIKTIEGLNVKQFKNLMILDLGDNQISNINLLNEVFFKDLNKLNLYDNNIEDVNVFRQVPFKGLKELNLSYNKIKSINIINFMIFEYLDKLDLNGNEINDLKSLNLSDLMKVKELQLKNNKFNSTDEENNHFLSIIKKKYKDLKLIIN